MIKTLVACCVACAVVTLGIGVNGQARPSATEPVKVYVEPMGQDHEAFRFRKLISDHLARLGFTVASEAGAADLVLITTLSTPVIDGETQAYASVEVRGPDRKVLWTGEFPASEGWVQTKAREAVTKLAHEIAVAVQRRPS